jgi:hypothetical protein
LTSILEHIRSLELYAARGGARLVREVLPDWVCGRVSQDLITLHAGLSPEQELLTLVHELTHWLAHRDRGAGLQCTLYEYEAEAVEAIVMGRLGLKYPRIDAQDLHLDSPTDGLLAASVKRVLWASGRISDALGLEAQRLSSEAQAPIHLEASAGEEIILEYKQHGMSDFVGPSQAL